MLGRIVNKILTRMGYKLVNTSNKKFEEERNSSVKVGSNTLLQNFNIEVRNKAEGRIYMEIGQDSIVSGNFIFETTTGRIKIGSRTSIGGGLFVCVDSIEIGSDVMISWGCTIVDNNSHSLLSAERTDDVINWKRGLDENKIGAYKDWSNVKKGAVLIKDKAWIGFNSIILKGVTIGTGAIVGSGSIVTKDVPDFAVVAGNPAAVIKYTK